MKNVFCDTIEAVRNGAKFSVDFKKRNLKVGNEYVVKNGEYEGNIGLPQCFSFELLEKYYWQYKHSIPSERSDAKRKVYFKALKEKDLEDEDMLYGERREYAQAVLELYVLINIINGGLVWKEEWGKWFWQSSNDKDLVLLREWIDGE